MRWSAYLDSVIQVQPDACMCIADQPFTGKTSTN